MTPDQFKERLRALHMSQAEFAHRVEKRPHTISRVLRQDRVPALYVRALLSYEQERRLATITTALNENTEY